MSKEYRVVLVAFQHSVLGIWRDLDIPKICRVYNEPGVSWREAKKQLRSWYLAEAAKLRSIKEKDYFKHD